MTAPDTTTLVTAAQILTYRNPGLAGGAVQSQKIVNAAWNALYPIAHRRAASLILSKDRRPQGTYL